MQADERPEPPAAGSAAGTEATEDRKEDLIGNLCTPVAKENIISNSVNDSSSLINQERSTTEKHTDHIGALKDVTTDGLPPGWFKEVRFRKGSTRKKDPFYIDPQSGYEFRSLKDVSRFIETRDIRSCCSKPRKRSISEMNATRDSHRVEAVDNRIAEVPGSNNVAAAALKPKKRGEKAGRKRSKAKKEINLELNPEEEPQPKRQKRGPNSIPRKTKAVKAAPAPIRASPRLSALNASHIANAGLAGREQKEMEPEKEASEKIEGNVSVAEPAGEASVFASSWSDPCIEFALKTLTGDTPGLDGNATVQDSLHPPPGSTEGTDINCPTAACERVGMPNPPEKLYPGNQLHSLFGNWGES